MNFELGGVKIDSIGIQELHAHILSAIQQHRQTIIFNANANAIVIAQSNADFRRALNTADVVFCDGFGVLLAARLLGGDIRERVTYADWIYPLSAFCETHGLSVYLLGGIHGVAEDAAAALLRRYPRLRIAGTHHGYFDKSGADNDRVLGLIGAANPDLLLVGFGMPAQELWITRNLSRLQTRVILPCGACLDYAAGRAVRGPRWMTDHGLEWLARFVLEPRRLWQRYTLGNLRFALIVLDQKLHPSRQ